MRLFTIVSLLHHGLLCSHILAAQHWYLRTSHNLMGHDTSYNPIILLQLSFNIKAKSICLVTITCFCAYTCVCLWLLDGLQSLYTNTQPMRWLLQISPTCDFIRAYHLIRHTLMDFLSNSWTGQRLSVVAMDDSCCALISFLFPTMLFI